ncbi:DUF6603 domain-containing protein [Nitrosomonas ureae]|uniref:DUF6603 domain-containing protein n=1 Tax=Nitrosomonas ureae TaxID=44577 RepID=A0A286AL34_9PROT|nr:DUF6603 domain-containing protein [Nitrosomonas ureae]SOD22621.1 hypothetical protein SAMN06297164_3530 [Nitrosomonas ureae]
MAQQNALQSIVTQASLAIARLHTINSPERAVQFFRQLGYDLSPGMFGGTLPALATHADELVVAVGLLAGASGEEEVAGAIVNLMSRLSTTMEAISQLHIQLQASGGAGVPNITEFPRRLSDFLILDYFHHQKPELHETLHLLGLIDNEPNAAPGQTTRLINWNRFGQFLNEPGRIFNDVYRWDSDFDITTFLARLEGLMGAVSLPGGLYPQSETARAALGNALSDLPELRLPIFQKGLTPETYSQFGITFSPAEAKAGKKKGIALLPYLIGTTKFEFEVCDRGELAFEQTADIRGIGIVVRPPFSAEGLNLTGSIHFAVKIREKPDRSEEIILIGSQGGTRLSIKGLGINWFVEGPPDKLDLGMEGEIQALRLVIAGGEGDGFLQKILSGLNVKAEAGFAFGISLQSGFTFRGGSKLTLDLGTHLDLGAIKVDALRFALSPANDNIGLEAGALLKFDIGPMQAVVENIGLRAALHFRPGNLGPADLDIAFMPPNGVGLSLDAGGFKGGGFLLFNEEKGEYAGALQLDFKGMFSVKAIGIINTKMPDGSAGFSLLIIITAEFTPIQLSFGFTLNGVGGIIGLNRTIFVSALAEGVRTNAIKSILFPENIVANISRIISDIKQFFPPMEDHFVIGPMGKLGWGTPSIITVELGLLLDLPNPMFAIVGVLKAVLPHESAPLLRLQVNFIGILDFDHGYIFFRADLYDSRLLLFSITGSMAFLVSWGEQKTFALSVGGFHPDFRDFPSIPAVPDGFRNMARIGISLLSDDNPRLKIECYFAVTSNTVQFGAKVELYAEAIGFNVYGFLGYDVLFQFDPFRFIAGLSGCIALREDTSVISGINILAQLAGPTLWDARGEASLKFLIIKISVNFHVTWGDPPLAIEPATEDLLALLKRELADTRNWRAELPPRNHFGVTLKKIEPPAGEELLIVYPSGVLTFSQRSLPLEGYVIQKYGNKKPLKENSFTLSNANSNGKVIPADFKGVREQFAPGNFSELSDSDKLSRKSFEQLPSGFKLTTTSDLLVAAPVSRPVRYELNYLRRKQFLLIFVGIIDLATRTYNRLVKSSPVRQSALSHQQTRKSLNAPAEVFLPQEMFALASMVNLKSHLHDGQNAVLFATQAEAYQKHQEIISQNPTLAGQIQVVSHYELNQG